MTRTPRPALWLALSMPFALAALLLGLTASLRAEDTGAATSDTAPLEPTHADDCTRDEVCAAGELCIRGSCRAPACRSDAECAQGEACATYRCVTRECGPELLACTEGESCIDGRCWAPFVERVGADRRSMVLVPARAFAMGATDAGAVSDERPSHTVELGAFWLDQREVSVADYVRCVDAGGCAPDAARSHGPNHETCNLAAPGRGEHPINCVTWQGALDYCTWAGKRLPTEAEWELAAGGDSTDERTYPWGDGVPRCDKTCRQEDGMGCGSGTTCTIDAHPADRSPYGVINMGGNVGEWCSDWYETSTYRSSARLAPTGPASAERRVVRGADFEDLTDPFRIVSRNRLAPDLRAATVGVRCASDL